MFRTKSRSERAADTARAQAATIKDQAAALKERVGPTAAQSLEAAALAAGAAKEWAAPHVGSARHWAAPRLEKARERGAEVAAPRVEHAAEALSPKVDAARDKIVDDVLPRLVEAIAAAAAAAAIKTDEARDRSQETLAAVSKSAHKRQKPRGRKRRALLVVGVLGAAAGAGYAAWRRGQPTDDPWATPTPAGGSGTAPSGSRLTGGEGGTTLGAGSLATQSADVDTPTPDGESSATSAGLADGTASHALDDAGTAEIPGVPATGEESASEAEGSPKPSGRRKAGTDESPTP